MHFRHSLEEMGKPEISNGQVAHYICCRFLYFNQMTLAKAVVETAELAAVGDAAAAAAAAAAVVPAALAARRN